MTLLDKLMGHRGARGEKPENTMQGFEYAHQIGLKKVELDIHKTIDDHLVVIHDDTLDRTTNGHGPVKEKTWKEIQELQIYDENSNQLTEFKVPELREVLAFLKKNSIEVQIEIKCLGAESLVLESIEKSKMLELSTVISFNHRILKNIKKLNPKIKTTAIIYGLPLNPSEIVKACGANGLSVNIGQLEKELVEDCHKNHHSVTVWNANSQQELDFVISLGVDIIATDYPAKVQAHLKQ